MAASGWFLVAVGPRGASSCPLLLPASERLSSYGDKHWSFPRPSALRSARPRLPLPLPPRLSHVTATEPVSRKCLTSARIQEQRRLPQGLLGPRPELRCRTRRRRGCWLLAVTGSPIPALFPSRTRRGLQAAAPPLSEAPPA